MNVLSIGETTVPVFHVAPRQGQVRVILKMKPDGLHISAPRHVSAREIQLILSRHQAWIENQWKTNQRKDQRALRVHDVVWLLGLPYQIERAVERIRTPVIHHEHQHIWIPASLSEEQLHAAVYRAIRKAAHDNLQQAVWHAAATFAFTPRTVVVKEQKSRFGSCSSQGNVNINWRLYQAPPVIADYVIVHELAHLREMNHSRRFWNLVASMMPDYETHRLWLKRNGDRLFALQPDSMRMEKRDED